MTQKDYEKVISDTLIYKDLPNYTIGGYKINQNKLYYSIDYDRYMKQVKYNNLTSVDMIFIGFINDTIRFISAVPIKNIQGYLCKIFVYSNKIEKYIAKWYFGDLSVKVIIHMDNKFIQYIKEYNSPKIVSYKGFEIDNNLYIIDANDHNISYKLTNSFSNVFRKNLSPIYRIFYNFQVFMNIMSYVYNICGNYRIKNRYWDEEMRIESNYNKKNDLFPLQSS